MPAECAFARQYLRGRRLVSWSLPWMTTRPGQVMLVRCFRDPLWQKAAVDTSALFYRVTNTCTHPQSHRASVGSLLAVAVTGEASSRRECVTVRAGTPVALSDHPKILISFSPNPSWWRLYVALGGSVEIVGLMARRCGSDVEGVAHSLVSRAAYLTSVDHFL